MSDIIDGIDPDMFDDDGDLELAKAAQGLFTNNHSKEVTLDDSDLFIVSKNNETIETSSAESDLFTTAVEYRVDLTNNDEQSSYYLIPAIIMGVVIVVCYAYYLMQKSGISKMISKSKKEINVIL